MAVKKVTSSKDSNNGKGKGSAASAKATDESKVASKVVANPRLVEALQNYDTSKEQTKSYLIEVAVIAQDEKLTKEEIVVSIMEARGVDRDTAKQQYSRIKGLLKDPKTLEELKTGVIDLATARARTVKKQANPSTKKKQENSEKVMTSSITRLINAAKTGGFSLTQILETLRAAAKKAGLK